MKKFKDVANHNPAFGVYNNVECCPNEDCGSTNISKSYNSLQCHDCNRIRVLMTGTKSKITLPIGP